MLLKVANHVRLSLKELIIIFTIPIQLHTRQETNKLDDLYHMGTWGWSTPSPNMHNLLHKHDHHIQKYVHCFECYMNTLPKIHKITNATVNTTSSYSPGSPIFFPFSMHVQQWRTVSRIATFRMFKSDTILQVGVARPKCYGENFQGWFYTKTMYGTHNTMQPCSHKMPTSYILIWESFLPWKFSTIQQFYALYI